MYCLGGWNISTHSDVQSPKLIDSTHRELIKSFYFDLANKLHVVLFIFDNSFMILNNLLAAQTSAFKFSVSLFFVPFSFNPIFALRMKVFHSRIYIISVCTPPLNVLGYPSNMVMIARFVLKWSCWEVANQNLHAVLSITFGFCQKLAQQKSCHN